MRSLDKSEKLELSSTVEDLIIEYGVTSCEALAYKTGMNSIRVKSFLNPGRYLRISEREEECLKCLREYSDILADESPEFIREFINKKLNGAIIHIETLSPPESQDNDQEVEDYANEDLFIGKPTLIALLISVCENLSISKLRYIKSLIGQRSLEFYKFLTGENLHENFKEHYSDITQISKGEEIELVETYIKGKNSDNEQLKRSAEFSFEKLLESYTPLIEVIAALSSNNIVEFEDKLQNGRICLYETLENFDPKIRNRIYIFFLTNLFFKLLYSRDVYTADIHLTSEFIYHSNLVSGLPFFYDLPGYSRPDRPGTAHLLEWYYNLSEAEFVDRIKEFAEDFGLDAKLINRLFKSLIIEQADLDIEEVEGGLNNPEKEVFGMEIRSKLDSALKELKPNAELILRKFFGLGPECKRFSSYELAQELQLTRAAISLSVKTNLKRLSKKIPELYSYLNDDFIDMVFEERIESLSLFQLHLDRLQLSSNRLSSEGFAMLQELRSVFGGVDYPRHNSGTYFNYFVDLLNCENKIESYRDFALAFSNRTLRNRSGDLISEKDFYDCLSLFKDLISKSTRENLGFSRIICLLKKKIEQLHGI